jgi:pimeloyl-ACP methyl ester carboxylesterase
MRQQTRLGLVLWASSVLGLSACGHSGTERYGDEPPLETDAAVLEKALKCTPFEHPDKPAVLLVHGTFTTGFEQYDWTYFPLLAERGFDVCTITYPDRGLGDMQVSAEYVVYALRTMQERTMHKVAMIGHSQGAAMPRWALKWWHSARTAVEDFVLLAGPAHGGDAATLLTLVPDLTGLVGLPEVLFQFRPDSAFTAAVNRDDETPGDIDYTSLYTVFDELVRPVFPEPTAALDLGRDNPHVTNLLLQDLCPGRIVEHGTIGLTDRLAFRLALDAISNPGPANIERAGGAAELCGLLPIIPDQIISSQAVAGLLGIIRQEIENGLPQLHLSVEEPPLREYAR